MNIIHEIREAIGWAIEQVVLVGLVVLAAVTAPIFEVVLPQALIILNPSGDFKGLATIFIYTTPVFVMFWMGVLCHFHSLQLWKKQGKNLGYHAAIWRESQGGWVRTVGKSVGLMALGLFGSFIFEVLFIEAFQFVPESIVGSVRYQLWFALFPLVAFTPVIVLLLKRRNYEFKQKYPQLKWSEARCLASKELFNSPELDILEAEAIAEARAAREKKWLNELGVSEA
jgi:hypothetical protein